MAVQMLVFEGDWSVYESTPPTPNHTPANGVEPVLKIRVMKMGFQAGFRNNRKKYKPTEWDSSSIVLHAGGSQEKNAHRLIFFYSGCELVARD